MRPPNRLANPTLLGAILVGATIYGAAWGLAAPPPTLPDGLPYFCQTPFVASRIASARFLGPLTTLIALPLGVAFCRAVKSRLLRALGYGLMVFDGAVGLVALQLTLSHFG